MEIDFTLDSKCMNYYYDLPMIDLGVEVELMYIVDVEVELLISSRELVTV